MGLFNMFDVLEIPHMGHAPAQDPSYFQQIVQERQRAVDQATRIAQSADWLANHPDFDQIDRTVHDVLGTRISSCLQGIHDTLTTRVNHLMRATDDLRRAEESVLHANKRVRIELAALHRAFRRHPNVDPQTIQLADGPSWPNVSWVCHDVLMTPTSNGILAVQNGQAPSIRLYPFRVTLRLANYWSLFALPINGKGFRSGCARGVNVCHPHVLSSRSGEVCLGSSAGNIAEALCDNDVITAMMLCTEFFRHANPDDSAGQNWTRIPLRDVGRGARYSSARCIVWNNKSYRVAYFDGKPAVAEIDPNSGRFLVVQNHRRRPTPAQLEEMKRIWFEMPESLQAA